MRSAQPRTGILQKNCKEDELFLESVQTLSRNKSGKDLPFMIFDARFVFLPTIDHRVQFYSFILFLCSLQ